MDSIITLDSYILLSTINLKLRNYYKTLTDLCDDLNIDIDTLKSKLLSIGYIYNTTNNQFISIEVK